jgi:acetyltransferase-like isoleucine patch superfamily enzyme
MTPTNIYNFFKKQINRYRRTPLTPFTRDYYAKHPFCNNIHVGDYTYGYPSIFITTGRYDIYIGKFCSIAGGVHMLVDTEHPIHWVTQYPLGHFINSIPKMETFSEGRGDMHIGNNVWIGLNSLILSGVTVGDGAVIGAGSVVTKDVNEYEIVGGNPAKHIRFRFEPEQINALKEIKWWDWPVTKIQQNSYLLRSSKIDEFIFKISKGEVRE